MNLRFRSEFFNIFNHPNFGNPVNSLTIAVRSLHAKVGEQLWFRRR
jgi:hypothetical protein